MIALRFGRAFGIARVLTLCCVPSIVGCQVFGQQQACGFKETKTGILVLKSLTCAYPVYAATFKAEYDFLVKSKGKLVELSTGGEMETRIHQLYAQMDQINADVRTNIVSAYSAYVTAVTVAETPEERQRVTKAFEDRQAQILQLTQRLREVAIQAQSALVNNSNRELERTVEKGQEVTGLARQLGLSNPS